MIMKKRHKVSYQIKIMAFSVVVASLPIFPVKANEIMSLKHTVIRQLVEIKDMIAPAVSPDGKWVVFGVMQANIENNSYAMPWYILPTDGSVPPRLIWSEGDLRIQDGFPFAGRAAWSLDSRRFAFPVTNGDEARIYVYDMASDRAEQVGPAFGTVEEFTFTDKNRIALTKGPRPPRFQAQVPYPRTGGVRVPYEIHRQLALGIGGFGEQISATGSFASETVTLTVGEAQAQSGKLPATAFRRGSNVGALSAFVIPAVFETTTPQQKKSLLERHPILQDADNFGSTGDGEMVAYTKESAGRHQLFVSNRARNRAIGDIGAARRVQIVWTRDSNAFFTVKSNPEGWQVVRYSKSGERLDDYSGDGQILVAAGTDANGRLIALWSDTDTPGDLVAINNHGLLERLTSLNPAFASIKAPRPQFIQTKDRYGREVSGRFYMPTNCKRPCPVVTHIYGSGGFPRGGNGDEWPFLEFLRRGIAVIDADPPHDEEDYSNQGTVEGTRKYVDGPVSGLVALIDQLSAQGQVDSKRVGIVGLSFGAMVASWGAIKTDRFAASSSAGIDVYYAYGAFVNGHMDDFVVEAIRKGDGAAIMEYFGMNVAPTLQTAMLSHEPEEEYRSYVPLIGLLKRFNRPVEQFVYANEGHVKTQPANRFEVYRRNAQWFDFWLNDGAEDADLAYAEQYARWRGLRQSQQTKPEGER